MPPRVSDGFLALESSGGHEKEAGLCFAKYLVIESWLSKGALRRVSLGFEVLLCGLLAVQS